MTAITLKMKKKKNRKGAVVKAITAERSKQSDPDWSKPSGQSILI